MRAGGADAVANARLREVLAQAKLAQLPSDIIDRNIKKASEKNAADYSEVRCCGPGQGGREGVWLGAGVGEGEVGWPVGVAA